MDLRSSDGDRGDFFWPVFGDVALAMLLLFLLLLVVQVIEFRQLSLIEEVERQKAQVASNLNREFSGAVVVDEGLFTQRVSFSSDMLFKTCGADTTQMRENAAPTIRQLGGVLRTFDSFFKAVEVEGHTDERDPITGPRCPYESNWQLSSERATTVVSLLESGGLESMKLSAVGRSEYQPLYTPGAAMSEDEVLAMYEANRRIEIVLQYKDSKGL